MLEEEECGDLAYFLSKEILGLTGYPVDDGSLDAGVSTKVPCIWPGQMHCRFQCKRKH
jgi:hypothetical protein